MYPSRGSGPREAGAMLFCSQAFALFFVVVLAVYWFFFQAEDGIRDLTVTGVQTCALPILDQEAVPVELPVLDDESDVELPARQAQGRRGIQLVPGVEEVGVEEEPGEPPVDVRADRKSVV